MSESETLYYCGDCGHPTICDEVLFLRAEVERLTSALAVERHAANVVAASAMQSQAEHDEEARRLRELESATGSWGLDMQARAEQAERERDEARAEVDNLRADLAAALARERNAVAMVREDTERARGLRSELDAIPCPACGGEGNFPMFDEDGSPDGSILCETCNGDGAHPDIQAALKACRKEGQE